MCSLGSAPNEVPMIALHMYITYTHIMKEESIRKDSRPSRVALNGLCKSRAELYRGKSPGPMDRMEIYSFID